MSGQHLRMEWSAAKPTEPGHFYWFKSSGGTDNGRLNPGAIIMWVYEAEDDAGRKRLHANNSTHGYGWVDDLGGEWAGPILEPK